MAQQMTLTDEERERLVQLLVEIVNESYKDYCQAKRHSPSLREPVLDVDYLRADAVENHGFFRRVWQGDWKRLSKLNPRIEAALINGALRDAVNRGLIMRAQGEGGRWWYQPAGWCR